MASVSTFVHATGRAESQRQALAFGGALLVHLHGLEDVVQAHGLELGLDRTGIEPGDVQQAHEQVFHRGHGLVQHVGQGAQLGGLGLLAQQAHQQADGGGGLAQVVAGRRQEAGLALVGHLQRAGAFGHAFFQRHVQALCQAHGLDELAHQGQGKAQKDDG